MQGNEVSMERQVDDEGALQEKQVVSVGNDDRIWEEEVALTDKGGEGNEEVVERVQQFQVLNDRSEKEDRSSHFHNQIESMIVDHVNQEVQQVELNNLIKIPMELIGSSNILQKVNNSDQRNRMLVLIESAMVN